MEEYTILSHQPKTADINFALRLARLDNSFKAIATNYKKPWQRHAALSWISKFHNLNRSETRRLFALWLALDGGDSDV